MSRDKYCFFYAWKKYNFENGVCLNTIILLFRIMVLEFKILDSCNVASTPATLRILTIVLFLISYQ